MDELAIQFKNHTHDGINSKLNRQRDYITTSLPGVSPATGANYGIFFIATYPCIVKAISEVHTTAGTDVGAVSLQIERLQGTEAPDSGDLLLDTAFNLKGTANTVQEGVLTSVNKTFLSLNQGDRLCLRDIGTLTLVAGVCVTVQIQST